MKRISGVALVLAIILALTITGCEDDSQSTEATGFELVIEECLSFGVYVYVDGEFQDFASTDEPHFFPLPAGTYDVWAYGNATIGNQYACWSNQVTVRDTDVVRLTLFCSEENICTD
ncbi:MAG: hypothetical protein KAV42_04840 [Candidatus Krumholzibacteria bacterium]|nr:hypothetical protein [Candidatus Krumholzibacteria bacterium]